MTCYHSLMRQLQSCEKDIVTFLQKRKTSWQRNPCNKPDLTLTRLDLTSVEMIVPSGTCARLSSVTIHLESLKCRGVTQASDCTQNSRDQQKCLNDLCCTASADSVKVGKVQKSCIKWSNWTVSTKGLSATDCWTAAVLGRKEDCFMPEDPPWLGYKAWMCPKTVLATRTSFHSTKEATVTTACA